MALTKIINDENKSYRPVLTDKLVLDAVPTVNSFNSVTSDAVARAIAGASGEVPAVTESDNGKVLTAVYDAGGAAVEWAAPGGGGVPDVADPLYVDTDDAVALRYGSGLYLEDGENYNDTLAVALSGTGGLYYDTMEDNALAVQVDPAGGLENFIDDGVQIGLRAKVDGTTIGVNASGELEALGGGGSSYTAGNGIEISGQNAISVSTDNATLDFDVVDMTLTSNALPTAQFTPTVSLANTNTCTLKLVPDSTITIVAPSDANGKELVCRLRSVKNSTTIYAYPQNESCFYNNSSRYVLSSGTNTISTTLTLKNEYDSTTFNQFFYPPYPATYTWDDILLEDFYIDFGYADYSMFDTVFGTLTINGGHVEIVTDAGTQSLLKVTNPLPASTAGDQDKVLTVNSSGAPVWATPAPPSGVMETVLTPSQTASTIDTANLPYSIDWAPLGGHFTRGNGVRRLFVCIELKSSDFQDWADAHLLLDLRMTHVGAYSTGQLTYTEGWDETLHCGAVNETVYLCKEYLLYIPETYVDGGGIERTVEGVDLVSAEIRFVTDHSGNLPSTLTSSNLSVYVI